MRNHDSDVSTFADFASCWERIEHLSIVMDLKLLPGNEDNEKDAVHHVVQWCVATRCYGDIYKMICCSEKWLCYFLELGLYVRFNGTREIY